MEAPQPMTHDGGFLEYVAMRPLAKCLEHARKHRDWMARYPLPFQPRTALALIRIPFPRVLARSHGAKAQCRRHPEPEHEAPPDIRGMRWGQGPSPRRAVREVPRRPAGSRKGPLDRHDRRGIAKEPGEDQALPQRGARHRLPQPGDPQPDLLPELALHVQDPEVLGGGVHRGPLPKTDRLVYHKVMYRALLVDKTSAIPTHIVRDFSDLMQTRYDRKSSTATPASSIGPSRASSCSACRSRRTTRATGSTRS